MGLLNWLRLPRRHSRFFEDLLALAKILRDTALLFQGCDGSTRSTHEWAAQIKDCEHDADQIVRRIDKGIMAVFLLPLDKEDLKRLIELLDDVVDYIEEAANRVLLFELPSDNDGVRAFAKLLVAAATEIYCGVELIAAERYRTDGYIKHYIAIHTIENQGDDLHRSLLALANDEAVDMRLAWKWLQVYQLLENALDACEDLAIEFEHIRIKYS